MEKKILAESKKNINFIIAVVVVVFFILFSFTKAGRLAELSLYDNFLKLKSAPSERDDILLMNVDDLAIEEVGTWPWSRDVIADVLIRLRELGGKAVVFDIEYLSPGPAGVNRDYVEKELPNRYSQVQADISEYIKDFASAIEQENIPISEATSVGQSMSEFVNQSMSELGGDINHNIFRDNDEYFGRAIHFFGNTFVTVNSTEINIGEANEAVKDFAFNHFLFENIDDSRGLIKTETLLNKKNAGEVYGMSPAILPILQNATGAGFPNVVIDEDGVRRRIALLSEYNGKYIGQLVFTPILNLLKPEKIIRKGSKLILKNITHPDYAEKKDMVIPLDSNGHLLIDWSKKKFVDINNPENSSFKNISIYMLIYADIIENNIMKNLSDIYDLKISTAEGFLAYHDAVGYLQSVYEELAEHKKSLLAGSIDNFDEYFERRKLFFDDLNQFLDGGFDKEIHDVFAQANLASGSNDYDEADAYVTSLFEIINENYKLYNDTVFEAEKKCKDAVSIIGYSGVGTSDLGVNPFWTAYPNVGTHANIYNTIMNENFITPVPFWFTIFLTVLLSVFVAFILKFFTKVYTKLIFGFSIILVTLILSFLIFNFARVYIQTFMPTMSIFFTFLIITIFNFVFAEKEKSFLRKAFGVYLSKDVVDEIVSDPDKLTLGGEEKHITAFFTDIRSFSTLSETVTPSKLVQVLNVYLTTMSDLIFDEKGTIDKYIGDAIVAFFGAPLELPNHASAACHAAIKMKKAEDILNKELYEGGEISMPINTRIGINTGDMVIGNMGTDTKMNYTMMGNDVNLAARLEGVNKKYGTWVLASEKTWNETNGEFLGRRLDRVRVVGINTPVQLYNIMDVKANASDKALELVDTFEKGISLYREKDYKSALTVFEKCSVIDPDDVASTIYIRRMQELLSNPEIAAKHVDIINMTSK